MNKFTMFLLATMLFSLAATTAWPQPLSVSECAYATTKMLDADKSDVPPAIQELRRRMLDADVNTLTFHNMDEIFWTRTVPRAGPVWQLPVRTTPLTFTYALEGKTYTADAFLERTFTNALLIMKDGVILSETYRNNTGPQTRFISFSMLRLR